MTDLVVMPSCAHLTPVVAEQLGSEWQLSEAAVTTFSDGEALVRVVPPFRAGRVAILGTMAPPQPSTLLALCQAADAVRQAGATDVHAVIPYLAYSRQDRVNQPGEAVTGALVLELLARSGCTSVSTIDTHNEGLFERASIPVRNLFPLDASVEAIRAAIADGQAMVVAPDAGAYVRSELVARALGARLLRCIKTKHDGVTQIELPADAADILSDERAHLVVVDDVTSSGSTVFPLLAELEACAGRGLELLYVVTHVTSAQHPLLLRPPKNIRLVHSDTVLPASAGFSVAGLVAADLADWHRSPERSHHVRV